MLLQYCSYNMDLGLLTNTSKSTMKVTQAAVRPTESSIAAGRPALTPELLAASGARYSRNNEGLESILSKIDPNNLDKSVDSIFKMVDYGHQSIADMAPVALFIDNVSIWLAYYIWTLCPTAGGQESSTRYIKMTRDSLVSNDFLDLSGANTKAWTELMDASFTAYQEALLIWESLVEQDPGLARIPKNLLEDASDKALKQVARLRRNYAFDRARYFLPAAVLTNVMMIMSARGWVQLCQSLLSHPLLEAVKLGEMIGAELALAAPRMLRHAAAVESTRAGQDIEFEKWVVQAQKEGESFLHKLHALAEHESNPYLEVFCPKNVNGDDLAAALAQHQNRYAWMGPELARVAVRFGWTAMTMAEIRDLNRHRTGSKYCPLIPRGFYCALSELPAHAKQERSHLEELAQVGIRSVQLCWENLTSAQHVYIYWSLLGTQYQFEHLTTADKFIYEAELRTGTGAHFRYAEHLHDVLELWYKKFPQTRGLVLEGSAEPE
jgi:thymidylate synthase ThyX